MSETEKLKKIIFSMLNFTNMYCLVLDHEMHVKFVNLSLAIDLGFESYEEVIDQCWMDFIIPNEKDMIKTIHHSIANNLNNWERKYVEVQSTMLTKNNKAIEVYWFNSHINTDLNWTFSFGIKKRDMTKDEDENLRDFYFDMIKKDRVLINSMRDSLGLRNEIINTCKPNFVK
jgi:hypothetical protein